MPKKYNKVIYDGNTLIDLTSDTITAANLVSGVTAHDAAGEVITGTLVPGQYNVTSVINPDTTQNMNITDPGTSLVDSGLLGDSNDGISTATINAVTYNGTNIPLKDITADATMSTGSQMLNGITAYSQGSKYTGSIVTWNGEKKPLPDLCFTANTAGSTISMQVWGTPTVTRDLKYTTDSSTWLTFIPGTTTITLANAGDKVYFKGNNPTGLSEDSNIYYQFVMTGSIAASGNIMSLIDNGTCTCTTIPNDYCFNDLFYNCSALTSPPELPATGLTKCCYQTLFGGCTSLTSAPELPATTLASECYNLMFTRCTALVTPPALPATTLHTCCYQGMFNGCSSLSSAPILSATTMTAYCYRTMFADCIALTTAPALPATTLEGYCYNGMFWGCTALTTIPNLPATTLKGYCYSSMFRDCTSLVISDTSGTGYDKPFVLPPSGTFTNTWPQNNMFTNCLGTRASDGITSPKGNSFTYYTQNTPI